jgi:hypothetical protein
VLELASILLMAGVTVRVWRQVFSEQATLRRQLAGAPRSRIGDVRQGVVSVQGRVALGEQVLVAPLSGRRCAAFRLAVPARVLGGDSDPVSEARPFWLDDGTGLALVEAGTDVVLALRPRASGRWGSPRRGYREGLILEGEIVSVAGHAALELSPSAAPPGPRKLPACLVLRAGGSAEPLLIADDVA